MGLSAFGLASGIGSKTRIPLGPRLSMFLFNLRPMITSFLEHGIFEPVVNPIPIILAMWMFRLRLNHRTHTPIPRLKMVTGSPEIPEKGKGRLFALKDRVWDSSEVNSLGEAFCKPLLESEILS